MGPRGSPSLTSQFPSGKELGKPHLRPEPQPSPAFCLPGPRPGGTSPALAKCLLTSGHKNAGFSQGVTVLPVTG